MKFVSSEILKKLSAKYNLQTYASGRPITPKRLAERLNLYAGSYLTKSEKQLINNLERLNFSIKSLMAA